MNLVSLLYDLAVALLGRLCLIAASPSTHELLAQLAGLVLAGIIFWRAECGINRMSRDTLGLVRIALVLLAVGSAAAVVMIALGSVPDVPSLVLYAGIAALLFCERRIRVITRLRGIEKGIHHAPR